MKTDNETLKEIAGCLSCIAVTDLTRAENTIARLLVEKNILKTYHNGFEVVYAVVAENNSTNVLTTEAQ